MMNKKPICSIIVPVYNEEPNLLELYTRLVQVTDALKGHRWEFILIDDGSTDRSLEIISDLHVRDSRVKALSLSRNFGSHVAIAAGLDHVHGDITIIMASDLQDPPELLGSLLDKWHEGYQVVWASRESRDDPLTKRLASTMFYKFIRRIALPNYPEQGTGSFCLLDRQVVNALRQFPERNRVTFGLISWVGFRQTQVSYQRAQRFAGHSKWGASKLIKTGLDATVMFSYLPLRMIMYLGMLVSFSSFLFTLYIIAHALVAGTRVSGWPSIMVIMLMLGGVQLIVLGVLGEYLWRSLEEGKQRPLYIIQRSIGFTPDAPTDYVDVQPTCQAQNQSIVDTATI
jgi:dolichol-phosphate mannosyltransferase